MSKKDPISIEINKLEHAARLPERTTTGAAGYDLRACLPAGALVLEPGRTALVPTGLAIAVPPGFEGQVRARSGLALKHGIAVLNAPGTIDSDYRGPLGVILANLGPEPFGIRDGDRIAQIVFAPVMTVRWTEVDDLSITDRGEGGFGHTGVE